MIIESIVLAYRIKIICLFHSVSFYPNKSKHYGIPTTAAWPQSVILVVKSVIGITILPVSIRKFASQNIL